MKKWSHFFLALTFCFGVFSTVEAGNCCDPCQCPPANCGGCGVEIGAEFLYTKFCFDDFDYAYILTGQSEALFEQSDIEYKKLCLDYEPGVRAWLGFGNKGCIGMTLGYTYLSAKENDYLEGSVDSEIGSTFLHPYLVAQTDGFDLIAVEWENFYHEGQVVFGSEISCGQCHQFKPYIGVAGIYLEQKFDLDLSNLNAELAGDEAGVEWESQYWGVGLRFGSEYNYKFDQCFGFFGKFNASLLVGENKAENNQYLVSLAEEAAVTELNFIEKDKCHFVPGCSVGVGFSMTPDICGSGSSFSLRVGYEFQAWYNIPNHRTFSGDNVEINEIAYSDSASTRTWGSHGLFAGVQIGF